MKNVLSHLNEQQTEQLKQFFNKLSTQFNPEKIYCFGARINGMGRHSCFISDPNDHTCNYDLLLITADEERREYEIQDYVNEQYLYGKMTILCHSSNAASLAIENKNHFFTTVFRDGLLLYHADGTSSLPILKEDDNISLLQKSEQRFNKYFQQARHFFEEAEARISNNEYKPAVSMLHQALKQACIGLIAVFMVLLSGCSSSGETNEFMH